jgi:hypothetical protein
MKLNIDSDEVKNILEMHSKMKKNKLIITEQESTSLNDSRIIFLRKAIGAGCLSNGKIQQKKSTGEIFFRKNSVQDPSKQIDFFSDMTYKFTDGSKSGKWKCDKIDIIDSNISKSEEDKKILQSDSDSVLKEKKEKEGWMEYSELVGKGYSQLDANQGKYDTIQFKLSNGKTITLYKPKVGVMSGQQKAMTDEQQSFISKWVAKGGKLTLTPDEQASQKFKKIKIPGSEVAGWTNGLEMWFDINSIKDIAGTGKELKTTIENQVIPLDQCKTFVDQFFKAYQDDSDIPDFDILKRQVKRCKSLYSPNERTGRKNGWGIFSDQKNKIDTLSGLVSGKGPSSYGPDSKWRIG